MMLPKIFESFPLVHAISSRQDDNMSFSFDDEAAVASNRRRFLEHSGISPSDTIYIPLVHGDLIWDVGAAEKGVGVLSLSDAPSMYDAIVTNTPGVFLMFCIADCLPMSIYDPIHNVCAIVHLGWKGTTKLFAKKIAEHLKEKYNSNPNDLYIHFGPSIKKTSYIHAMQNFTPAIKNAWGKHLAQRFKDDFTMDIPGFAQQQVREAGVPEAHIEISPIDTYISQQYFSHRRSKHMNSPDGRFALVFGMLSQ